MGNKSDVMKTLRVFLASVNVRGDASKKMHRGLHSRLSPTDANLLNGTPSDQLHS